MTEILKLSEHENGLETQFISRYLAGESVESLIFHFPYSQAHGYRLLDKWGVIKSAGRSQSSFGKAVYFLTKLVQTKLPLEQLYFRHMPSSIKEAVSRSTLHRIAQYARRGVTRTKGTALVVTPQGDPTQILVGQDVSIPNPSIGKFYGALSYPMTYSVAGESSRTSIARVLQQELLTKNVLDRTFSTNDLDFELNPFMHIVVADVDVSVFHATIPWQLTHALTSAKLKDLRFVPISDISSSPAVDLKIRAGVTEIANGYLEYLEHEETLPTSWISELNIKLALIRA